MTMKKKKTGRRKISLSADGKQLMINDYIIAVVNLKRNKLSITRSWCEHVGLKLCVGESFHDCKTVKKGET